MRRHYILFVIFILILGTVACLGISQTTPTPYPTYTPLPTYTPQPKAVDVVEDIFTFAVTLKSYSETDETISGACEAALGPGWRTADWNDITGYVEAGHLMADLVSEFGDFTNLWVTYDGESWYSEQRHYFIEVHNHNLPDGWLSNANIDDHYLDLGSWYDMELGVLCIQSDSPAAAGEGESVAEETTLETPQTPPAFELSFYGIQPCGEWPNYAVFEVENTTMWTLQSAHFEITNKANGQSVYTGNNDRPFLKEGNCPPGQTVLAPYNTRLVAANLQEPQPGTEFNAAITLCTEESIEDECTEQIVDFVFEGEQTGDSELPFVGIWENESVGMVLVVTENNFVKTFAFEGGQREIFYTILDYDVEESHLDLLTDQVLQDGEEVDYAWEDEQYLSYTISDDVMKMFIGPNPYPNATAGLSYNRQETGNFPEGDPSFELSFVETRPCAGWPSFAAFQVINTSEQTFESVRLEIRNIANDQLVYGGNNNRGFVKAGGCPPGDSTLPPNSTSEVAANIKEPEPGTEFEATIKLCTQDDLDGECVSQTVTFIFEE